MKYFKNLKYAIVLIKKFLFDRKFEPIFRLSHFAYSNKYGHEACIIQVIGKNFFTEFDAKALIENKNMLRGFSHEDVVKITLHSEKIKKLIEKNLYKVRETFPINSDKKDVFIAESEGDSKNLWTISLKEIEEKKNLIDRFEPKDAFFLGKIKTILDIEEEQEMIRKIRSQNVKSNIVNFTASNVRKS